MLREPGPPREKGMGSMADNMKRGAHKARTVAIINNKGGVGKTTTAKALSEGLNEKGFATLLVDMDAQANLTTWLGIEVDETTPTIYDVFSNARLPLSEVIVGYGDERDGGDVVPGDIRMKDLEQLLSQAISRESRLKRALAPAREVYDYIIIDCPPSLGLATVNALVASDELVIVTEPSMFAITGFGNVYGAVENIKFEYELNPDLKIAGILINKYAKGEIASKAADEQVPAVAKMGDTKVFGARPTQKKAVEDAANNRVPLFQFRPNDPSIVEFRKFVDEFLESE